MPISNTGWCAADSLAGQEVPSRLSDRPLLNRGDRPEYLSPTGNIVSRPEFGLLHF